MATHTYPEARRAPADVIPIGQSRQGEERASHGCDDRSSPAHSRRRRYYRIGHYYDRHPLGVLGQVKLLLAYNRTLPAGERIRWGGAMLTFAVLFVAAAGWAVVL